MKTKQNNIFLKFWSLSNIFFILVYFAMLPFIPLPILQIYVPFCDVLKGLHG